MMKILEEGPGFSIEQICTGKGNGGGGCSSRLLVEEGDIYLTSYTDISGVTDCFYTFTCPVCDAKNDIDYRLVPVRIQYIARKRKQPGRSRVLGGRIDD